MLARTFVMKVILARTNQIHLYLNYPKSVGAVLGIPRKTIKQCYIENLLTSSLMKGDKVGQLLCYNKQKLL